MIIPGHFVKAKFGMYSRDVHGQISLEMFNTTNSLWYLWPPEYVLCVAVIPAPGTPIFSSKRWLLCLGAAGNLGWFMAENMLEATL